MFRQFALEEVVVESVDVQRRRPRFGFLRDGIWFVYRDGIGCGGRSRIDGLFYGVVNYERRMVLRAIAGLDGMDVERSSEERVRR